MITKNLSEKIQAIKDEANLNNGIVSRRLVYDIIKDKNNEISEEEIEAVCYSLMEKGIEITETDEEGYTTEDRNQFIPADVNIGLKNISLDIVVSRLENKEIDLNPDFQRRPDLWSDEQKSRLIESLMLRIPLPAFYFDASNENNWIVIDGLQRLSAIKGFIIDNSYVLTGLQYLTEFNGRKYEELPRQYVRRIVETQLVIYTVEKGTPKTVVFNIFQRLNTGGLILTTQEIRHALNQGQIIKVIEDMATTDEFKKATGYSIKSRRMLDCEYATRYIAFTRLNIDEYNGNIDDFLNHALMVGNKYPLEELERLKKEFKRDLRYSYDILGRFAFRRIKDDETRGPINKALFECILASIHSLSDNILDKYVVNKECIQKKYANFTRSDFSVYLKAGDKYTVKRRLEMTKEFFEGLQNVK